MEENIVKEENVNTEEKPKKKSKVRMILVIVFIILFADDFVSISACVITVSINALSELSAEETVKIDTISINNIKKSYLKILFFVFIKYPL